MEAFIPKAIDARGLQQLARSRDSTHTLTAQVSDPMIENLSSSQAIVWVHGMKHTGSTMIMDFVRGAVRNDWKDSFFGVFEPCHQMDQMSGQPPKEAIPEGDHTCGDLLSSVASCDFGRVERLYGWQWFQQKPHYDKMTAHDLCEGAQLNLFKTIHVHDLEQDVKPLLEEFPRLHVVHIVRDPRAVFSTTRTWYTIPYLCDIMRKNSLFHHERVFRLKYEDFVTNATDVGTTLAAFLAGDEANSTLLRNWTQNNMNVADCEDRNDYQPSEICVGDSAEQIRKWMHILNETEQQEMNNTCADVLDFYGYK
eukprot:TRINITY_DN3771_c0_g1_i4.p1 TRINITY_DN3771_c0_g1~~TRINITY_DN3771_c0_g1_i4.p1  ORF type:complete len:309 (-),score=36.80 TRINITY_DN3771_c0_g1_i4:101-1027(-)